MTRWQFNTENENSNYLSFRGKLIEQMPVLVNSGRVPMSVADIIDRRLEVGMQDFPTEVRESWHHDSFDTGDAVFYHPDGRIKIVLDAKELIGINGQIKSCPCEGPVGPHILILQDGVYEEADGIEFTREEYRIIRKDSFSKNRAKSNPFWKALARDQGRLNDYVDFAFDDIERNIPAASWYREELKVGLKSGMGIMVGYSMAQLGKIPTAKPVLIGGLNDIYDVDGSLHLTTCLGNLIGVFPKSKSPMALEERV